MICNLKDTIAHIKNWQSQGKSVTLVTGVFDLLHIEHIRFLSKAKALGDKLIVGIETDVRVARMKGNHRPINNHQVRLEQLDALKVVDNTFLLPETFDKQNDWVQFMSQLKPNYYAVSSNTSFLENKQAICTKTGVTLKSVHPFNPVISSTKLTSADPAAEEPQK